MIEALDGANSLPLYQLKALIEAVLADPTRPDPTRTVASLLARACTSDSLCSALTSATVGCVRARSSP